MVVSTIAGDYDLGLKVTCILNEGNPTVGDGFDGTGRKTKVTTWANQMYKGQVVAIDPSTCNTYEACGGLFVVKPVEDTDETVIGIIATEPELVVQPPSSGVADSLTKRLAGKYYRQATVRILAFNVIQDATLVTADAVACIPGVAGKLIVDVSESGSENAGLVLNDIASGGSANIIPLNYQAKAAGATVTIQVGITGMMNAQT